MMSRCSSGLCNGSFYDGSNLKQESTLEGRCYVYCISCPRLLKASVEKNSSRVMSRPSHSFFIVTIPGFLLSPLSMLFTVAWGTPARLLRPLGVMSCCRHSSLILPATASLVFISSNWFYSSSGLVICHFSIVFLVWNLDLPSSFEANLVRLAQPFGLLLKFGAVGDDDGEEKHEDA